MCVITGNFENLRSRLEVFVKELARPEAPQESLHECIKSAVQEHVKTALKEDRGNVGKVQKQMKSLCYDLLIPSRLHSWVLEQVEQANKELTAAMAVSELSVLQPTKEPRPPLFGKDTLHHASICCHAVSTCNSRNLPAFLRSRVSGHGLEGVSISEDKEGVDLYLIAKGRNTLYVAFHSELTLSAWMEKHGSFDEG